MYQYFKTEKQEASINNVKGIYDIVISIRSSRFDNDHSNGYIEVPKEYVNNELIGKAYIDGKFVAIDLDEVEERTSQLDIIEANTTFLVMMSEMGE